MTGPRFSTPSWSLEASLGMASQAYLPMPPKIAGDSRRQTLKYDALTNDQLSLTRLRPAPERRRMILLRGSRQKLEIRQGSSSRIFDAWYGTEEFGLQLRIGDVLSRLEVPAHGHHVAHERKE